MQKLPDAKAVLRGRGSRGEVATGVVQVRTGWRQNSGVSHACSALECPGLQGEIATACHVVQRGAYVNRALREQCSALSLQKRINHIMSSPWRLHAGLCGSCELPCAVPMWSYATRALQKGLRREEKLLQHVVWLGLSTRLCVEAVLRQRSFV